MAAIGPLFGLSHIASVRAGLLLAAGGEFAFVAFGEALSLGILPPGMVRGVCSACARARVCSAWLCVCVRVVLRRAASLGAPAAARGDRAASGSVSPPSQVRELFLVI